MFYVLLRWMIVGSPVTWPKRVMEQIMEYNILDFSAWEDDVKFEGNVPQIDRWVGIVL